ncbi:MAG: SWIM zinc finger family protein [Kiritimatiellia bacterium]
MSRKRYPLRVARAAHGIRAQDLRTLVRTAWWARRWIAALEAMRLGPRLGRGRQYAVAGQVTDLMLEGPHVEAQVTGSRPEPYRVSLDFTATSGDRVARTLKKEPMLLARLLTDDLPMEVEELLRAEGVPLFPKAGPLGKSSEGRTIYDVKMKCSCPDWARPCKHIAAVLLLLGEEIARRPATLLSLRGVDVDELAPPVEAVVEEEEITLPRDFSVDDPAPLLKRLGPVPFWRGDARCLDALGTIYKRVRPLAVDAAQGKSIDLRA